MDSGFEKGASDNLPEVDAEMISDYLVNNADFVSAEIKGIKASRATRQHYGDEAIGFVQLRRDGDLCTVKARVTPEHKVSKKDYHVIAKINEKDNVVESITCLDCVACLGGCKHSLAFLFWLHRRSEEPAVTSQKCYWKATKLSHAVKTKKFMKISELVGKQVPTVNPQGTDFREAVLQEGIAAGASGMIFNLECRDRLLVNTSIHQLSLLYEEDMDRLQTDVTADGFIDFCSTKMTNVFCSEAEILSREQADSPHWKELRYARITASRFHEASRCNTYTGVLSELIMGAGMPLRMEAVSRGKQLEGPVLEVVAARMDVSIQKCGIFLSKDYPIFGASPDGISDECCYEVKCPVKMKTVGNYIKDGKPTATAYGQMQLQMHLATRRQCIFCVASPEFENNNEVHLLECEYNAEYCAHQINKCTTFWKKAIFPKLFVNNN